MRRSRLAIITEASRHGSAATDRDAEVTGGRSRRAPPHSRRRPRGPLRSLPPPLARLRRRLVDVPLAMGFHSMSTPQPPNVVDFS